MVPRDPPNLSNLKSLHEFKRPEYKTRKPFRFETPEYISPKLFQFEMPGRISRHVFLNACLI